MDRIEIPITRESEAWIAAVERGDEVVLTRDGKPVAEVTVARKEAGSINRPALDALREGMQGLRVPDGGKLIRNLRDASDH